VQRVFYAANPDPAAFWESTFDEVLLVIQGQVDKWRIERVAAWKIVEGVRGSQDMPEVTQFYGLPYDHELKEGVAAPVLPMTDKELYEKTKELGYFQSPI
jgi:hypothetical protein